MNTRSRESFVTFDETFTLSGWEEVLPPGTYRVAIDEVEVADVTFLAYRRVAMRMHLPVVSTISATHSVIDVNPAELDRALAADVT